MNRHERRFQLVGWTLFLICAVFFIRSAMRNGDSLYLAGSVIFLVACIAFIIPLLPGRR
jgi:cyanate permease